MSAGSFSLINYVDDNDVLHPMTIQPETASLELGGTTNTAGTPGAGVEESPIGARVSGSRRGVGLFARMVTIRFGDTAGAAPDGYKPGSTLRLPILKKSLYDSIRRGTSGNYLGKVVTVVGKSPEVMR